jgi:hypothetical protein
MKRLSTALAPTLMTGALLGIGAASQAQTNLIRVVGDIPTVAARGSSFTLEVRGTQANAEDLTTTAQFVWFQHNAPGESPDSANGADYITVTLQRGPTIPPPLVGEFRPLTVNVNGGAYAGTSQTMFSTTYSFSSPGLTLPADTLLATLTVTFLNDAPGGFVDFGLGQAGSGTGAGFTYRGGVINDFGIGNSARTIMTTAGNTNIQTTTIESGGNFANRPGGFHVGIVPGPSSLAVFALGGFAPAMALLRRRRAAK